MFRCNYRLSNTLDPEERLEDAALSKALHDALGPALQRMPTEAQFPAVGLNLGRLKGHESPPNLLSPSSIPYWEDPAFRRFTSREWGHHDLDGAERAVARLHAEGRDAVVKSTLKAKHMVIPVPRGTGLGEALDAMVYSFCDRPSCLLVQEQVEMRFERRFLFLDGELLTQSAVGAHLTPMSRAWEAAPGQDFEDLHLGTPGSRRLIHNPALTERMTARALEIAAISDHRTFCMDLCLIGEDAERGTIEPIEWNPFQPGQTGLYGCDPRRIAEGIRTHLEANPALYCAGPGDGTTPASSLLQEDGKHEDPEWMDFDV